MLDSEINNLHRYFSGLPEPNIFFLCGLRLELVWVSMDCCVDGLSHLIISVYLRLGTKCRMSLSFPVFIVIFETKFIKDKITKCYFLIFYTYNVVVLQYRIGYIYCVDRHIPLEYCLYYTSFIKIRVKSLC